jgi:site-specific recombinase XerD
MPPKPPNPLAPIFHNGGIIRPTIHGTFRAELNRFNQRARDSFKTLEEAQHWIDNLVSELSGLHAPLSQWQLRDARDAYSLLPAGVKLTDLARAYVAGLGDPNVDLDDALDSFKKEREAAGRRPLTLANYDWKFSPLRKALGKRKLITVTAADLSSLLAEWKGSSRDDYRAVWSAFFSWAVQAGLIVRSPAAGLARGEREESDPVALSWRQAARLLRAAESKAKDVVPALAVALFAGLRPYELFRLPAAMITKELIIIGASASKIKQRRHVSISPTLRAWLDAYPPPRTGRLVSSHSTWRRRLDVAREAAGLTAADWVADILRHTCASHHLALNRDAALLAHQLGNSPATIYKDYRASRVTPLEGRHYFSLRPLPQTKRQRKKSVQNPSSSPATP